MNEREECKCGPYYDCEEHDTDPVRSRDKWRQRALAAEPLAADRAALVAQLEAARAECCSDPYECWKELRAEKHELALDAESATQRAEALVAQVAELTRERDEAHTRADHNAEAAQNWHAEVTRLTEALAAAERRTRTELARVDAAEARVTVLTCEKAALRGQLDGAESECAALRAELKAERDSIREFSRQLNEARAEVERLRAENKRTELCARHYETRLIEEQERFAAMVLEFGGLKDAAESSLAAANALLRDALPLFHECDRYDLEDRAEGILAAQEKKS